MDKETIRDYELDIIVKAWRDERFRKDLLKDPKVAIEGEFNIEVPKNVRILVHVEDEHTLHLIVPAVPSNFAAHDLTDDELKDVIGGVMATGHLSMGPGSPERAKLRDVQRENQELHKLVDKLKADLSALKKKS